MNIKEIRAVQIEAPRTAKSGEARRDPWTKEAEVANPMSRYPRYKRYRPSWMPKKWGSVWVQVIAEDGSYGLGQTTFGRPVAAIVDDHFAEILQGEKYNEKVKHMYNNNHYRRHHHQQRQQDKLSYQIQIMVIIKTI